MNYINQFLYHRNILERRLRTIIVPNFSDLARDICNDYMQTGGRKCLLPFENFHNKLFTDVYDNYEITEKAITDTINKSFGFDIEYSGDYGNVDSIVERYKNISDVTAQRVFGVFSRATEDHNRFETIRKLRGEICSHTRIKTIIKSEMVSFTNQSALRAFREAGVGLLEVRDSDGCGWQGCRSYPKSNGLIVSNSIAERNLLSHPNCLRMFVPHSDRMGA